MEKQNNNKLCGINTYLLSITLLKIDSSKFPVPTIPDVIYKHSRAYIGNKGGEDAKAALEFLINNVGLNKLEKEIK